MKPIPVPPGPGQESVWEYPRPPRLELSDRHIQVRYQEYEIADSTRAYRVLETSHPPTYYIPKSDIELTLLRPAAGSTLCEWKGQASYFDLVYSTGIIVSAAWTYLNPTPAFEQIAGYLAFYPKKLACYLDGERVRAQPGGFYGGWITSEIVGPFKGEAGTRFW